jgi:uncharacterized protein GlcG (DUF336 family)
MLDLLSRLCKATDNHSETTGTPDMTAITLAQANAIVAAALTRGRAQGFAPLTVVVLDPGGHVVAAQREDHSGILRIEIATGKAYGALGFGFGSRELFERSTKQPVFMAAVAAAAQGRFVPVPSGVLIRNAQGHVCGAVGVSGDTSDNDEICAVAGVEAAGLKPQVGAA